MSLPARYPTNRTNWWVVFQRWWRGSRDERTLRQQRGQASERLARAYLRRQGYQIEATNVRFPIGELDLIALEGDTLCVIEVRSKASEAYGSALESITDRKRRHLIRTAQWYLQRRRPSWTGPVRFDVLAIHPAPRKPRPLTKAFHRKGGIRLWGGVHHDSRRSPTLQLIRGAFTSDQWF